jgi:hypothetical protein
MSVTNWQDDNEQFKLFLNGAMSSLKSYKHMRITGATEDPVFKQALRIWGAPARYDLFSCAEDAMKNFSVFCSQWEGWTPTLTKCSFTKIAVNFVVPYGKGYIEFLAEGSPIKAESMSIADVEDAYRELWDYVTVAAQEFWRKPPQMALAAGAQTVDPNSTDDNVVALEVTHILREDKADPKDETKMKPYYKLFGGKFSKHGVSVYQETLEAAGVKLENIKPGKHQISKGAKMWVSLNKEDKPIKVVRLQRGT